jgi:hypothetical protein
MPFPKGHKLGNQFKPGQSGNNGGRPKEEKALLNHARTVSLEGLKQVEAIARDVAQAPEVRIKAWSLILDRAFGKPAQAVTVDAAVEHQHRFVIALPMSGKPVNADDWQQLYGRQELLEAQVEDGGEAGGDG